MYHEVVRRVMALVLLGLFSISLISPGALAPDPEAGLPACCRRNGKHHCAMVTEAGSESGPAVHSSPCLSFSGARAVPASPNLGVLATPPASAVSLPKNSANQLVNEAPMRGLFHAPRQLRGPPYLFFS